MATRKNKKGDGLFRPLTRVLEVLSWLAVLLLWGCAATVYVHPATYGRYFAAVGLLFPFFAAAVLTCAALCLLFCPRKIWISFVGFVACIGTVRDYCPFNLTSPPPKGCIKVLSYNTMSLGQWQKDESTGEFEALRYALSQNADIVCLQEAAVRNDDDLACVRRTAERYGYTYKYRTLFVGCTLGLASRYPVVGEEVVCRSESNGAMAYYLVPRRGDTIVVVNAHLESMHLSERDRTDFRRMVNNPQDADTIPGKMHIIRTIAQSGVQRALLADTLATFIDRHAGRKTIVMGDFNDTPVSYSHHAVCSRLNDAFRATSNGIGRSFNKDAIYVRIDNVFASSHFKPYAAKVDGSVPFSDHYPIVTYLKEQK